MALGVADVIFDVETAAFADAVRKAFGIAKASTHGIQILADKKNQTLEVVAFSRESTYRQYVLDPTIHESGNVVVINDKFNRALNRFPTSTSTKVGIDTEGRLTLTCGRLKGKYVIAEDSESYPHVHRIQEITSNALVEVEDLSAALKSVSWVAQNEREASAPWTGVTIDGATILACSKTQLCEVDLVVPVDEPITVPAAAMASVVPRNHPVEIGAADYRFLMRPDPETEITTSIYAETHPIPALQQIREKTDTECHERFKFDLEDFSKAVGRIRTIADQEAVPRVSIHTEGNELVLSVSSVDGDSLTDAIECERVAGSDEAGMVLDPKIIAGITSMRGGVEMRARPGTEPPGMVGFFLDNGVRLIAAAIRKV